MRVAFYISMSKLEPTRDMETFVRTWSPRVRATLRKFGAKNSALCDDLEQDVYVRMLQNNTLGIWDVDKGSFATHIFQVIRTVALNSVRARKRNALDRSERIDMTGEDGEQFLHPEVAKLLKTADAETDVVSEFMERLYEELHNIPSWTSGSRNGRTVKSLSKVCQLWCQGYSAAEIARVFRVGPSSVSAWLQKIKQIALGLAKESEDV